LAKMRRLDYSTSQWRYLSYAYMRQVEMLDADVGRILDALESSGQADSTMVVFTSDHGESRGRHGLVGKWYPYDDAARVPLIVSWPGQIEEGMKDDTRLVSGMDVFPTVCDLAGIKCAPMTLSRSLRPLLQKHSGVWRDYLVYDTQLIGRTVRTADFKYVEYEKDPQTMLFDMGADRWETRNLADDSKYQGNIADFRRMMEEWNARLEPVPIVLARRAVFG
jgi:arylsulfatase A-like enzyme